ncbi:MAG: efflux RND transporter permease subunit [Candidatus Moranbacteria bacterium]|nr:efflux RND transporter permease subunit [Candidatus Moranbacteria bacterium]
MQQADNQYPEKRLGFFGKMAKSFIDNPIVGVLAVLFIVLWGVISYISIPKAYNPEIIAPAYAVVTDFPGATVNQVYELVTRPTENALNELPHVDKIVSQSFDGGRSVVTVQFEVGTSMDSTKTALNQKLKDNASQRPIGVQEPLVSTMDPDDVPIINIALTSDKYSETALRSMAYDVADQLKLVDNTSKITVVGGRTNNLQVELDAQKLAQNHIAISDVVTMVRASSGIYSVEPLSNNDNVGTLRVNGSIASVQDAENILLVPDQDHPLKLGDVSKISEGPGELVSGVHLTSASSGETNVVYVNVAKIKGSNITTVASDVNTKLADVQKQPEFFSVKFAVTRDDGQTASEEIGMIMKHLLISTFIVVGVLLLFLSLKDALNVALAIPLTLLVTFGLAIFAKQTVNRVALFGIIVALGLLVDNAIVVIENIHRITKKNPQKKKAKIIVEAANEVGMGVFMSTLTVVAAFMPMYIVSGMMGSYISPIPFFVSVSMLASLVLAFTVNPALATKLSADSYRHEKENMFQSAISRLRVHYSKFVRSALEDTKKGEKILISVFILCLIALLLPFFQVVKINLVPKSDAKQFYIYLDMPNGTPYEKTNAVVEEIEKKVLFSNEIYHVESFVGTAPIADFNGLFKGSSARIGENQATLKVDLMPKEERKDVSGKIVQDMRDLIGKEIQEQQPDAKLIFVEDPAGPPVRSAYYLKIQGDNQELRERTAKDLQQLSESIPGVADLNASIPKRSFEKQYHVDIEKAARLGIAPASVIDTLHVALSGTNVALYNSSTNDVLDKQQHFITVRMQTKDRSSDTGLSQISVRSSTGASVPISQLLVEDSSSNEISILSDQRQETTYITGEMGKGQSILYAGIDLFPKLFHYHLSDGTGKIVSWSPLGVVYQNSQGQKVSVIMDGEWKQTLDTFRDIGMIGGITLVLIYLMLLIQTRSLKIPILVMATIPLGLIGVFFGFGILYAVKGIYFSAMAALGIIALTGIVVKNAILYLAYLDELKAKEMNLIDALVEAGSVRLLPILLTSMVAVLGSFTIVTDATWQGLAWSLIFGLFVSTALTMVIFPLLYFRFESKSWKVLLK